MYQLRSLVLLNQTNLLMRDVIAPVVKPVVPDAVMAAGRVPVKWNVHPIVVQVV